MTIDWLLRVGDGDNLKKSSRYRIWGINSSHATFKHFFENVKPGDRLWFVKQESHGKLIAVATYCSHNKRIFGPLIDFSMTNEELGWNDKGNECDTEIHYTNLYGLENCELLTHIQGPAPIRTFNEKCKIDLLVEYSYIVRYSKITFEL